MTKLILLFLSLVLPCLAADRAVTVLWDFNTETNVTGYQLYTGPASRSYNRGEEAGYTNRFITTITGATYFAVTAYDRDGLQSAFSAEVFYDPAFEVSPLVFINPFQVVWLTNTVPILEPPALAPRPGFLFTIRGRYYLGGPITSITVFVGEGESRFYDASAVFTNDVPKSFSLLQTAPRKTISLVPPNPTQPAAPVSKYLAPVSSKSGKL